VKKTDWVLRLQHIPGWFP